MILRGAPRSGERVALGNGSPKAAPPPAAARGPTPAAPPSAPSPPAAPPPKPEAAPLTAESVLSWLKGQDERTRTLLCRHLTSDLENLRSAAAREGFAAGQAQGAKEAQAQAQAAHAQLQTALALLNRLNQEAQSALTGEASMLTQSCADIVLEVLTRLAGPALTTREAVVGQIQQVLKRLTDAREIRVRVSEADLPWLKQAEGALRACFAGRQLTLVPDPQVKLGGCQVDTKLGRLDGRLETQLQAAFEAIHAARARRGQDER